MRRGRLIGVGVAIVIVAFGLYFRVVAAPWLTAPDPAAVASAWSAIEAASAQTPPAPKGGERFDAMLAAAKAAKPDLEKANQKTNPSDTLAPKIFEAFEALAAWAGSAGVDEGPFVCVAPGAIDIVALTHLSQVALVWPPIPAHAAMLTTLSERLRRRGGLLHYVVGMAILDRLLERAALNPQGLPPYLKDTHADGREMRAALARDHVCVDRFFDGPDGDKAFGGDGAPMLARPFIKAARERAMLRLAAGRPMIAALQTDDPAAIAKALTGGAAEEPSLPSVAVRASALRFDFHDAIRIIKRYDELRAKDAR